MLSWMDYFTALIQLISAVNFVYIITHFPKRVFKIIFDKKKFLGDKFHKVTSSINADIQSVNTINLIETTEGGTNLDAAIALVNEYENLKKNWNEQINSIKTYIDKAKKVKGSKCLFLYVSLYCIVTLFNIAILQANPNDFWICSTILMNIIALGCSIYYTYVIWTFKWDAKDKVRCYVNTSNAFIVSILAVPLISGANSLIVSQVGGFPINETFVNILLSLCVFLPFYPCLMTIFFVYCHKLNIKKLTKGKEITRLEEKLEGLKKRKKVLENIGEILTTPKDFN